MTALSVLYNFLRPYKKWFIRAMILTTVATALSLLPPMILRTILDKVIHQQRSDLLVPMMILFVSVPLAASLLGFANNYVISLMGDKLCLDLRSKLYGHLQKLPLGFYDKASTGSVMERLMGDVGQVRQMVAMQTITLATDVVACVVALMAMFYLSPQMAILPMLIVPLYVLNHRFFRKRIRDSVEQWRGKMDQISGSVQERLRGAAVVKAFGQEQAENRRNRIDADEARDHGIRAHGYAAAFGATASLQAWAVRTGLFLLGYYLLIQGTMSLGSVFAFTTYCMYLVSPAVRFAQMSNIIEVAMVSVRRIQELMDESAESPDPPGALHAGRLRGEVELRDVCFEYETGQPVLENINLKVPAGATVALVGHTGCGKTTIVSLLCRFYEPTKGQVLVDGHDIAQMARAELRKQISLVPQEPVIFECSARENIAYGWPAAPIEKVHQAARIAEIYDVIASLPNGFDTKLGEEEAKLSVGQKQRMMIARAVLTDPAMLILDEATSSLDGESERVLQDALERVMRDRTSIVVAHRLSTIVNADLIVVLDAGKIVETGSHKELLHRPQGHYRQLYLRQFAKVA